MAKLRTHTQEVGMVRYIPKLTSLAQQFQPFSKRYGKAAYIYIQPRTITNHGGKGLTWARPFVMNMLNEYTSAIGEANQIL